MHSKGPSPEVSKIFDLINFENLSWKVQLVNQMFHPVESHETLKLRITEPTEDKIVWNDSQANSLTCELAYKFLDKYDYN